MHSHAPLCEILFPSLYECMSMHIFPQLDLPLLYIHAEGTVTE